MTDDPCTPDQAVFEFSNWKYICGQKIDIKELKVVSPEDFLKEQLKIVRARELWARNPKRKMDSQYFCKSLIWLCVAVHRLKHPACGFSWQTLNDEANEDTLPVIQKLLLLKQGGWDTEQIQESLPYLYDKVNLLTKLYS